jgi:hypothetical protein
MLLQIDAIQDQRLLFRRHRNVNVLISDQAIQYRGFSPPPLVDEIDRLKTYQLADDELIEVISTFPSRSENQSAAC